MTTKQSRTLYDQYIELTEQVKELEGQRSAIADKIFAKMDAEKIYKAEGTKGIVRIAVRAKWTYSPTVQAANDNLRALKKTEEQTGVAKKEETRYLVTALR